MWRGAMMPCALEPPGMLPKVCNMASSTSDITFALRYSVLERRTEVRGKRGRSSFALAYSP
jgi:hypothetical protein